MWYFLQKVSCSTVFIAANLTDDVDTYSFGKVESKPEGILSTHYVIFLCYFYRVRPMILILEMMQPWKEMKAHNIELWLSNKCYMTYILYVSDNLRHFQRSHSHQGYILSCHNQHYLKNKQWVIQASCALYLPLVPPSPSIGPKSPRHPRSIFLENWRRLDHQRTTPNPCDHRGLCKDGPFH